MAALVSLFCGSIDGGLVRAAPNQAEGGKSSEGELLSQRRARDSVRSYTVRGWKNAYFPQWTHGERAAVSTYVRQGRRRDGDSQIRSRASRQGGCF